METFMPFNQQMTATEDTTVHLGSTNLILLTQRTGPLCLETAPFWDYIQVNYAQKAFAPLVRFWMQII